MVEPRIRVLIASNSQGTAAGVPAGANYPCLLRDMLGEGYEVHWLLMSGWTLADLRAHLRDNALALRPHFVVLQFGIVEAPQRILSVGEKVFLGSIPFGRYVTAALFRQRASVLRLRRRLGIGTRVMSIDDFGVLAQAVRDELEAAGIRTLFLRMPEFADGGRTMAHPFINDDIAAVNDVIERFRSLGFERSGEWPAGGFQDGTVHFSVIGHRVAATRIADEIRSLAASAPRITRAVVEPAH